MGKLCKDRELSACVCGFEYDVIVTFCFTKLTIQVPWEEHSQ